MLVIGGVNIPATSGTGINYRETIYEAREGSRDSGEYHGYPLQPTQEVQGLP
ncbi:hypothetical protein FLM9_1186 [Candidatus Synechococcus spongiarum]|uniref:Uncharacterized protein n=1 Tax=Candidatus Synechococcus spongiarum TaxID=431041 RepID=A0A164YXZ8_9SYNE|nr:hypothetical protein FLM9_1186 [Candidatus Synechococcus spongiarum]